MNNQTAMVENEIVEMVNNLMGTNLQSGDPKLLEKFNALSATLQKKQERLQMAIKNIKEIREK